MRLGSHNPQDGDTGPTPLRLSSLITRRPNENHTATPSRASQIVSTPTFTDSPNARSKTALNQHPSESSFFVIGISEDKGSRRTMEDAYGFVADFANVRGQGYWAIFDGHAGKHAAEWCGSHFHEYLLDALRTQNTAPIPEVLNTTFHAVDSYLSKLAEDGQTHSGCTVVTAFLRIEDEHGGQSFLNGLVDSPVSTQGPSAVNGDLADSDNSTEDKKRLSRIRDTILSLGGSRSSSNKIVSLIPPEIAEVTESERASLRRVLYTANVGDARAVLCRGGKAVRLTYDHKGSDKQEAKRIMDAGGFVMNNRVNGVLAVTRALGDSSMKEFVVGSPYTTETELSPEDEFLVVACDGLWDVVDDQKVVELVRTIEDPQEMSETLLKYALEHFTTDNVTVLVVRFKY
ncbi:hypothetical protein Clacol_000818 [Clathrus columnatus]|uniref:PPM-type phosphatase domain-containing protein n=1 Tax=Clathrus columnatus TaxID=1419009 RepID=A0AAV5A1K6_9AGAM|nr:hypothetical protein Clacol_000818 [Clathrus columnatus]